MIVWTRKERDIVELKEIVKSPDVDKNTFGKFVRECRETKVIPFVLLLNC